jgi:hypothetical protein
MQSGTVKTRKSEHSKLSFIAGSFPLSAILVVAGLSFGLIYIYRTQRDRFTFVTFAWLVLISFTSTLGVISGLGFIGYLFNFGMLGFTADNLKELATIGSVFFVVASIYWFVQFLKGKIH